MIDDRITLATASGWICARLGSYTEAGLYLSARTPEGEVSRAAAAQYAIDYRFGAHDPRTGSSIFLWRAGEIDLLLKLAGDRCFPEPECDPCL